MFRRFFLEVSLWSYIKVYHFMVVFSDAYENLLDQIHFDALEDREEDPIFQNQIEVLESTIDELEYKIYLDDPLTLKEQAILEKNRLNRFRKNKGLLSHERIYTCDK